MIKLNSAYYFTLLFLTLILSCSTTFKETSSLSNIDKRFLMISPETEELFRVILTSDKFLISQMRSFETINRNPDKKGDIKTSKELEKYNKIDEIREGIISIWLFPDSGKLMKVRPKKPTYLIEIDNIIINDIQRWIFNFPSGIVEPNEFEIKYRIILRKLQSDEDIMKEVREKILKEN